ncbi:MAG: type I polyketide synthase [Alphaproteobacteria bacterium]|nr:hypothetical protein [Hyphomonas sp.]MBR9805919.1 type I polyketide synthase [Alphaproteobacteria bacterium]
MTTSRDMLKDALSAIERLQSKLDAAKHAKTEPIAIIGCGMRYPGGVKSLDDLHNLLAGKVNAVDTIPADRWDADAYYSPDQNAAGKIVTKKGGFVDGIDLFDPQFFGISPREAKSLDPQQRLLLQTAHEAMETAGIAPDKLEGSATGVFVGMSTTEYARLMWAKGAEQSDVYSATGGALNAAPGRISFTYGFLGPSVAVDTACSSSLNAIHLACASLREGESNLALAGGAAVIALPDAMAMFSRWGMLSPDGACKTFDASANGFARAEGCAMIALKRLSDAKADGNPILGLIVGSATNSDGRSSGMTVPSGPAQERMLRNALKSASLTPLDIDYIETHGTGTPIGDPIEAGALGAVLCEGRERSNPLRIGSIKTNIGHTEAASGIAGLLKVLACMRSETLLPQLHFETPNPGIDWDDLALEVVTSPTPWPHRETPRRAGVSSFGFSGTNVHILLADAPEAETAETEQDHALRTVPLSAETPNALRDLAERYANYLSRDNAADFPSFTRTLAVGRAHRMHRAALVASSTDDLRQSLEALAQGAPLPGSATGHASTSQSPRIAFLCTGQGSQYPGMTRELYDTEPVFRASIDTSAQILSGILDRPLLDVLYTESEEDSRISETLYTQPCLFAVEYAMAELWKSWGVTPNMVAGHSIGEYVAACLAGVMSHEDALRLVAERGRLMQQLPAGGAMAAVFASEDQIANLLKGREKDIAIAGVNGPEETVISGSEEAVEAVLAELESKEVGFRRLSVSHAFHSPLLDPMLDAFEQAANKVSYQSARLPLISNLTGQAFPTSKKPDARYWRDHARGAVRFADCIGALEDAGADILIELGPQPALLGLAARARPAAKWKTIPSLRRGQKDVPTIRGALAQAYTAGAKINWQNVYKETGGRLVAVPTYPFQQQRYWIDEQPARRQRASEASHPLLGDTQKVPPPVHAHIATLSADFPAFLADHKILDRVIFPATGYIEMALSAGKAAMGNQPVTLSGLMIDAPLELQAGTDHTLHTELMPSHEGGFDFIVRGVPEDERADWQNLAHARVSGTTTSDSVNIPTVAEARAVCVEAVDVAALYERLENLGLQYGPLFRGLTTLNKGDGIAVGMATLPNTEQDITSYSFHPALLDSVFHAVTAIVPSDGEDRLYLPTGIDKIQWLRPAPRNVVMVARLRQESSDDVELVADLLMETEQGDPIARLEGLHARVVSVESLARALGTGKMSLNELTLSWQPVASVEAASPESILVVGNGDAQSETIAKTLNARLIAPSQLSAALKQAPTSWVISCAGMEATNGDEEDTFGAAKYDAVLSTLQTLQHDGAGTNVCVLTRGAKVVLPEELPDLSAGTLAGLCRTADTEIQTSHILQLDLDPHTDLNPKIILQALALSDSQPELALRNGTFFSPRLSPVEAPAALAEDTRSVLRVTERGDLNRLRLEEEPRTAPGDHDVEIAIRASGLNFRDVLNALGMYPGDPGRLGSECSGVVSRVGKHVSSLKPGDPVVALAGDSFASHVTVRERFVLPKPASITFADAVTLPNTYLTAALCFATAGGLKPGQRVLVHAAAGGVGFAAMQLALRAGAEVIATAGNERKRAFVLEHGASHAFDSRSDSFGEQIEQVTKGEGVDMVINALSGDMIVAGMRVTKPGGYFLEIGKNNIWTPEEAAERAPHVNYRIVDLGEQIIADPDQVRSSFDSLLKDVEAGSLAPLPVQAFPLSRAADAFRFMANARHTGKVAILPDFQTGNSMEVRQDGAYLVTGGLSGLGLAVAERLAKRGAGEIILAGRSGDSAEAQQTATRMAEAHGCTVRAIACDIADSASVDHLFTTALKDSLPLRGIMHAAGILDDSPLSEQSLDSLLRVAGPKIDGAQNLTRAASRAPLDWFVLFSSSSAMFGGPGQANYAGANAWLDSLAAHGRSEGRPITSIGWGAWADVGMAARLPESVRQRWERIGLGQIGVEAGLDAMEKLVSQNLPYASVVEANLNLLASQSGTRVRALLGRNAVPAETAGADASTEAEIDILSAPADQRPELLEGFLRIHVGRALGYAPSSLDPDMPISDLGFDSLMAVQVRNAITASLKIDIGLRDLLSGITINEAVTKLISALNAANNEAAGAETEEEWEEGVI